ncbi:hypothetical protein AMEX_G2293 [Astyanax mexicanus]|uniref:HECT domain-containing protein n=1 Tax=Astyanax mexicanus TaxID=7994 RepID=A0A8T2MSE8_ASTMX|nr:hypothetical protein AMEX_G2293 [Astyanax mexicanus]
MRSQLKTPLFSVLHVTLGGWGSRKLLLVVPEDCGYTGKILKSASKGPLYVAPLQEELDTTPLPPTSESFSNMPKALCQKCKTMYPLQVLAKHVQFCEVTVVEDCVEESGCDINEQKGSKYPTKAMSQFREGQLHNHATETPLNMHMDMRSTPAERDRALLSFYKKPHVEWARPLHCILEGTEHLHKFIHTAFRCTFTKMTLISFTKLFEGETDHLVPSSSPFLVDSDLFVVAGRILGHSFIHGGPCLSGLSPAFVHVLLGGNPDTATVQLNDCPDLDIRDTVKLVS